MDFEEHNLCVYRNPTPPSLVIRVAKPERSAVVAAVVANLPPVATYKLQCSLCQQLQSGCYESQPMSRNGLERSTSHNQWVAIVWNVLRVATNESQWSQTFYESQPMSRSGLKRSTSRKPTSRSSGLLNVRFANQVIYINFWRWLLECIKIPHPT